MIKMAVFAGNPGREYEKTRHNIAWMVLSEIQGFSNFNWKKKFNALWADYFMGTNKVIFLKPETFMNHIGKSVQAAAHFFKIQPEEIIVIHDDLELPFETLAVKKGGGAGGHNGLRSITQHLGSSNYYRLRMGIGRPVHGSVSSFVLGRFTREEEIGLISFVEKGASELNIVLAD